MGKRHCIHFLAWPIISTSSLATSVRRQRHYTNCCRMTYTGVGSQSNNKLSTPSRQTSPNFMSWGFLTPQSLSRCLSMPQRVVLVLHAYRMVTLWPMPHEAMVAETWCVQIKELLSATFACRKFHDFIFGRQATIKTNHKPLTAIINKSLHSAPTRLQGMLLQLQKCDLIRHVSLATVLDPTSRNNRFSFTRFQASLGPL